MPGLAVAAVNFANTTRTVTIPLSMVASGWCETPLFGNAFISLWGKRRFAKTGSGQKSNKETTLKNGVRASI